MVRHVDGDEARRVLDAGAAGNRSTPSRRPAIIPPPASGGGAVAEEPRRYEQPSGTKISTVAPPTIPDDEDEPDGPDEALSEGARRMLGMALTLHDAGGRDGDVTATETLLGALVNAANGSSHGSSQALFSSLPDPPVDRLDAALAAAGTTGDAAAPAPLDPRAAADGRGGDDDRRHDGLSAGAQPSRAGRGDPRRHRRARARRPAVHLGRPALVDARLRPPAVAGRIAGAVGGAAHRGAAVRPHAVAPRPAGDRRSAGSRAVGRGARRVGAPAVRRASGPEAFALHLDGPWGAGKTTVAHFVAEKLRRPAARPRTIRTTGSSSSSTPGGRPSSRRRGGRCSPTSGAACARPRASGAGGSSTSAGSVVRLVGSGGSGCRW